jgi:hypothetical protein
MIHDQQARRPDREVPAAIRTRDLTAVPRLRDRPVQLGGSFGDVGDKFGLSLIALGINESHRQRR